MISLIKRQGIKFQAVFWVSLISTFASILLFSINYSYYRKQLTFVYEMQLKSVSELVAMSTMFDDVEDYVNLRGGKFGTTSLLQFMQDMSIVLPIDGSFILYRAKAKILLLTDEDVATPFTNVEEVPPEVLETAKNCFNSGKPELISVKKETENFMYYIYPVMTRPNFRYAVCTYVSSNNMELYLIRYSVVNFISFFIVLIILDVLLIFAVDSVLIKPILEMERKVNYFIYNVSGSYETFLYQSSGGNEIQSLQKSVLRLEGLIKMHSKKQLETERYEDWLKSSINHLDVERQSLQFDLMASKFETSIDKETLCGNSTAWQETIQFLNHDAEKLSKTSMLLIQTPPTIELPQFIDRVKLLAGILPDVPMKKIFRISDNEFVIILYDDYSAMESLVSKIKSLEQEFPGIKISSSSFNRECTDMESLYQQCNERLS